MIKIITILSGYFTLSLAAVYAQEDNGYPAPKISTIMVRLDKLPIDAFDIQRISSLLSTLARTDTDGSMHQLRNRAQLLALAMRLNNNNKQAVQINENYKNGSKGGGLSKVDKDKAIKRLKGAIQYLSRAEADSEAHVLVNYMKDAFKGFDTSNAGLANHKINRGRWENVLSDAGRVKPKLKPEVLPEVLPDTGVADGGGSGAEPLDAPDEANPAEANPKEDGLVLKWGESKSSVSAPIYFYKKEDDKDVHWLDLSRISLEITPNKTEKNEIVVSFSPTAKHENTAKKIGEYLMNYLKKQGEEFPSAEIKIKLPEKYSQRNHSSVHFPIALQVQASLSGKKLLPNVIALGAVGMDGGVKGDSRFWSYLKLLRESSQLEQILICPLSAKQDFLQLVAFEETDFFIRNEVIGVENIDDAVKYSTVADLADVRKAHEVFLNLQQNIGTRSVGQYASNKKVRDALAEILVLNPNHISAEMIMLRGDIKRSKKIESKYVAIEVNSILEIVKRVNEGAEDFFQTEQLAKLSQKVEEKLSSFEDYVDSDHDDLLSDVEGLITELNNMSRGRKKKESDFHKRSIEVSHRKFKKYYKSISFELERLNGLGG